MDNVSYLTTFNSRTMVPALAMIKSLAKHTDSKIYAIGVLSQEEKLRLPSNVVPVNVANHVGIWRRIPDIPGRSDHTNRGWDKYDMATLSADLFCDTEYIVRVSNDVIFSESWNESELFEDGKPIIPYFMTSNPSEIEIGPLYLLRMVKGMSEVIKTNPRVPVRKPSKVFSVWNSNSLKELWRITPSSRLSIRSMIHNTYYNLDSFEVYGHAAYYSLFDVIKPSQHVESKNQNLSPSGNAFRVTGYRDYVTQESYENQIKISAKVITN